MNIWDHSRLSVRKFGGQEQDYYAIHKFIDSSKFFYHHIKHRLLLHHLLGVEWAVQKFGDCITNCEGIVILVRDIVVEHIKEDHSGYVPSLYDWLVDNESKLSTPLLPNFEAQDTALEQLVWTPLWRSNLKSALLLTCSNFGVYLANELLGLEAAKRLQQLLQNTPPVQHYLEQFSFTQRWQFSPDRQELAWLKQEKKMPSYSNITTEAHELKVD
ncbi:MAG: hypothetical protein AB8E82_17050 [Aureispira sp.]